MLDENSPHGRDRVGLSFTYRPTAVNHACASLAERTSTSNAFTFASYSLLFIADFCRAAAAPRNLFAPWLWNMASFWTLAETLL
jgi:hypothetical protein